MRRAALVCFALLAACGTMAGARLAGFDRLPVTPAALAGPIAFASPASQGGAAAPDVWAPLRFLLGSWETTSKGQAGNGTGTREYTLVLRNRFIRTRTVATYPPQPQNAKGETHEDEGYVSYDRARKVFVFRQFHVEGFVNTYAAAAPADKAQPLVFTSEAIENIPPGYRARETYRPVNADEVIEVFELAEPGKEFSVYSETQLKRRR